MTQPIRTQVRCVPHDEWYYPSEGCPICTEAKPQAHPGGNSAREWELKGFAYVNGGTMVGVNAGPPLELGETVLVRALPPDSETAKPAESLLHDMAAYKTGLEGKLAQIHSMCVQANVRTYSFLADEIRKIIEGSPTADSPATPARPEPSLEAMTSLLDLFRYAIVQCEELSGRYGSRDRECEARAALLAEYSRLQALSAPSTPEAGK